MRNIWYVNIGTYSICTCFFWNSFCIFCVIWIFRINYSNMIDRHQKIDELQPVFVHCSWFYILNVDRPYITTAAEMTYIDVVWVAPVWEIDASSSTRSQNIQKKKIQIEICWGITFTACKIKRKQDVWRIILITKMKRSATDFIEVSVKTFHKVWQKYAHTKNFIPKSILVMIVSFSCRDYFYLRWFMRIFLLFCCTFYFCVISLDFF